MHHYLIEITYTVPFEQVSEVLADHRAYLRIGYDREMLLMSGGQVPREGGIVLARAESREEVEAFCAGDPYARAGVATHRIVEFAPGLHQPFMQDWIIGN
jgi:uncharacterized protein YciI